MSLLCQLLIRFLHEATPWVCEQFPPEKNLNLQALLHPKSIQARPLVDVVFWALLLTGLENILFPIRRGGDASPRDPDHEENLWLLQGLCENNKQFSLKTRFCKDGLMFPT